MNLFRMSAVALATLIVAAASAGEIGDKAAKLDIAKWVKGDAVDVTKGDKVYVVEFWATWCPPCRQSIPHLTELQKKYGDKVVFIGVSDEDVDTVDSFVKKMGDQMAYTVAVDDSDKTHKEYMQAFGIQGIPHAFIINQKGEIVWHDHPMSNIDQVIDKVLANEFSVADAKKKIADQEREQKAMMETFQNMQEYMQLVTSTGKEKEARELGEKIIKMGGEQASLMNQFAWEILTNQAILDRDLKLALKAAEKAKAGMDGEDASVLDTYALALYENGQKDKAVEVQTKVLELAKKDPRYADDEDIMKEFQGRLDRFKKGN